MEFCKHQTATITATTIATTIATITATVAAAITAVTTTDGAGDGAATMVGTGTTVKVDMTTAMALAISRPIMAAAVHLGVDVVAGATAVLLGDATATGETTAATGVTTAATGMDVAGVATTGATVLLHGVDMAPVDLLSPHMPADPI